MLGNLHVFVVCGFCLNKCFRKNLSGTPSECQTVWTQIRSDLPWIQTVCKGYQQKTKVAIKGKRVECAAYLRLVCGLASDCPADRKDLKGAIFK